MNENREFDMLENADDKNVELLANVPVLTRKEKERMLKMSKSKLDKMNRESNIEEQVSGVEQYKRPKWYAFASIAACIVLVGGIVGTAFLMHRNGQTPDIDPMSEVTEPSTESSTEAADFNKNGNERHFEEIEELFSKVNEFTFMLSGGGVEVDEGKNIHYDFKGENDETKDVRYVLVTDERFSTIEEVKEYIKQYIADPMFTSEYNSLFVDSWSPAVFKEFDGKLYFLEKDDAEEKAYKIKCGSQLTEEDLAVFLNLDSDSSLSGLEDEKLSFSIPAKINDSFCRISGILVHEGNRNKLSEYSIEFYPNGESADAHPYSVHAILDNITEFEAISSGAGVYGDPSSIKEINIDDITYRYYRVTDDRFSSLSEVKSYLRESFTDSFLSQNDYLWDGYSKFAEFEGVLYFNEGQRGGRYTFTGEPAVTYETDTKFAIAVENTLPGGEVESLEIICVLEDDKWKVDSINIVANTNAEPGVDYISATNDALHTFFELENIVYGSSLEVDGNDTVTVNGSEYACVTSDRFSSVDEITGYIREKCCDKMLDRYLDTDSGVGARFIEREGKLYAKIIPTDDRLVDGAVSNYTRLDETDNSFTIRVIPPHGDTYEIYVRLDEGEWKLSGTTL